MVPAANNMGRTSSALRWITSFNPNCGPRDLSYPDAAPRSELKWPCLAKNQDRARGALILLLGFLLDFFSHFFDVFSSAVGSVLASSRGGKDYGCN